MKNKAYDEYWVLREMLEEISWAIEGICNDIDCNNIPTKIFLRKDISLF